MWKHLQRFVVIFAAIGAPLGSFAMWVAGNSIPQFIKDADGNFGTNLKWIGWENPPRGLASTAADHWIYIGGLSLVILSALSLLCVFIWHRIAPASGAVRAKPSPWEHLTTAAKNAAIERQNLDAAKAQIIQVLPQPQGDTPLTEGLAYVHLGRWGVTTAELVSDPKIADSEYTWLDTAYREFEQWAFDGKFGVWGKRESELIQPIPRDHWRDYHLDSLRTGHDDARTEKRGGGGEAGVWRDLMISRAQFEKEWPHAG